MRIRYEGQPAWRVAYALSYTLPRLEAVTINGQYLFGREIGYKIVFAETIERARELAIRAVYRMKKSLTRKVEFFNTEQWHGERLDKERLKRDYEAYKQSQERRLETALAAWLEA